MQVSKYLPLAIFLVVTLMPVAEVEAGWLDSLKEKVEEIRQNLKNKLTGREEVNSAPEAHIIYPEKWTQRYLLEPVFNSEVFVLEAGEQNEETVLLVHGIGSVGSFDWINVIPALEEKYHVLAIDLPGFGNSAKPAGQYSPSNYADILQWLVTEHIGKKVIIVGQALRSM